MHLFVLIKFKLTKLDFIFDTGSPIFGSLVAFEMIADRWVSFDADDCTPEGGPVITFVYRSYCIQPLVKVLGWIDIAE